MSVPRRVLPAIAVLLAGVAVAVAPTGPAAATGEGPCTLRPSTRSSPLTGWATCVRADAELATLPALGETTTLTVEVTAQHARSAVQVDIDLVGGLEWVDAPAGFEVSTVASRNPADLGGLRRAAGTVGLAAGESRRFTGTARATAAGPARVSVRGADPSDVGVPAGRDSVFLTVAGAGGTSARGVQGSAASPAAAAPAGAVAGKSPAAALRPAKPVRAKSSTAAITLAGNACVKGNWGYVDSDGALRVAPNYTVEVWDKDKLSTDDLLASVETDANGGYNVCFPADDSDGGLGDGGQDVFLLFLSRNDAWRVQVLGTTLVLRTETGVANNIPANTTFDFQFLVPGDPLLHLGVQAFDAANDMWNWVPGDCWDDKDLFGTCPSKIINWRWDATGGGTFYDPNKQEIFLEAADPSSRDTVVHELTHAVMDDVYEFVAVDIPNCSGHVIFLATSAGCAWVEGFAEWTPVRVYNDPIFSVADGSFINLEQPTWGTAQWQNGETVEGRVAGALIDLSDAGVENPWDKLAEGDANIWHTFLNHKSDTFSQFWAQRTADGFNVANSGGAAALYQNTIDKAFRDPLSSNVPVQRPTPAPLHNYSFNTTTTAWSVVAVRPPAGADHNLSLFDDAGQLAQLSTSQAASSTVDWIAIDSNAGRRPLGDYFPRVTAFSGAGAYTVEVAQSSLTLVKGGSTQIVMSSSNLVEVRDTLLTANVSATFKVTPSSATQDAELYIVSSTANAPATYVRNRASALKKATVGGPGVAETITFTPATSGWYGVILVHKAGSGTYTLARL